MYIGNACFHEWPMNSKKYEVWWIRWVIDVKVDDLQINFIWLLMSHQLRMFSIANRWILTLCIMYPCVCFQKWHFFLQTWSKFQLLWHLPSQSASKVDLSTVWDKGKNGKLANIKIRNNSFWKHLRPGTVLSKWEQCLYQNIDETGWGHRNLALNEYHHQKP